MIDRRHTLSKEERLSWKRHIDLLFAEGIKDEMMGKLQIKLGKTKEELHEIILGL